MFACIAGSVGFSIANLSVVCISRGVSSRERRQDCVAPRGREDGGGLGTV